MILADIVRPEHRLCIAECPLAEVNSNQSVLQRVEGGKNV
jgi:hypothetical protein